MQRCDPERELTPAEIIGMDWLTDNIVGYIPTLDEMKPEARAFVEVQGIHSIKVPETSEFGWTIPSNAGE